jgi:chorismate mutase
MHTTHSADATLSRHTGASTDRDRATERVETLRSAIDRIDEMLVSLIGERQRLARAVGVAKRQAGLPPVDVSRESSVIQRILGHAADHGVAEHEMRALAEQLIRLARTTQGLPTVERREAA